MGAVKEEISSTKRNLKIFQQKRKALRAHQLSVKHSEKMISFLKGRISGLEFQLQKRK